MGKKIQVAYEEEHTCKEGCGCLKPGARVQIEPQLGPAGTVGRGQTGYVVRVEGDRALVADADGENWYPLSRLTPDGSVSPEYASDSGYVEQVQLALADLGSDDPAGDIARNAKYVRGAKKAGLEPKQAAAMILAMSQRPADYQPRYRYEDVAEEESFTVKTARPVTLSERFHLEEEIGMKGTVVKTTPEGVILKWRVDDARWAAGIRRIVDARVGAAPAFDPMTGKAVREAGVAHEYIAVDSRGKKVFGPTDDFREATLHAKRAGGVVKFEMAREESAARDYNSIDSAERAAKMQGWTHVATLADSSRRLYKPFGNQGWTSAELYKKEGRWHIGGPSTEQIYTELPPHAALLGAWEAAAPPPASAAAPAAALEPYTKKVRFHRGTREGTYEASAGHLGTMRCAQRSPDRRNGRLPWYVVVKKVEIAQAATKTEVYALAEEWARAPKTKAEEPPAAAECTPVIRNGRVERQPDCKSTGVGLASAKDVWLITKDQYARQGHETFEVLGANLNSEMVDGPVTVAVGQTSGVRVEPEAVIIAALGLKNGGATQIWCSHPHPGGSPNPSPSDRNLDKAIREAFETLKSLEYKGQVVCTRTTFKRV